MPVSFIFHKRNAFTFNSLSNDYSGPTFYFLDCSIASLMPIKSCPSVSRTSHPKLAIYQLMAPADITSETAPSILQTVIVQNSR